MPFLAAKEARKCPNCGMEMEIGHLHFIQGLRWNKGEHKVLDGLKGELLFYGPLSVTSKRRKAWRCEKCGLILFDYREEPKEIEYDEAKKYLR
jgi:rubredoxin